MAWKCHSFNWEITNYFSASCYCATSESINLQKELNKKTWSGEKFRIGIANANRKPFHRQFFSWRHAAKVISDRPTCRFFIFRRVFFFSSALNSFFYTQRERKKNILFVRNEGNYVNSMLPLAPRPDHATGGSVTFIRIHHIFFSPSTEEKNLSRTFAPEMMNHLSHRI